MLKMIQPLELFMSFERGLDPLIKVIWDLLVKGQQSYCQSNFENDLGPVGLRPGLTWLHTLWWHFEGRFCPHFHRAY